MQVDLSTALIPKGKMMPTKAVVFYGTPHHPSRGTDDEISFAMVHQLQFVDGKTHAMPGRPLSQAAVKELSRQAQKLTRQAPEILPAHVLLSHEQWLVWWRPAGRTDLSFDVSMSRGSKDASRLQGVCLPMALPGLVFALRRGGGANSYSDICVYAVGADERPNPESVMYRAPLLNISDNGVVCWGQSLRPQSRTVNDIAEWERLFFSSQFTHYNGTSPVQSDEPYEWIADFCASGALVFPSEALKPMRTTLKQVVQKLVGDAL